MNVPRCWEANARTVYGILGKFKNVQEQVAASRGITVAGTLRKPPNCFQLGRQAEVLQRVGCGSAEQTILETFFALIHGI